MYIYIYIYIYINEIPEITGYHHFVCIHHYALIVAKTLSIFSMKILLNLVFVDQFGWGPGVLPFLATSYDLKNILGPKNANQNKSNDINMEKFGHTLRSCGPSKSSAIGGWFPQSSPSFLVFSKWGGQNLMLSPLHLHYIDYWVDIPIQCQTYSAIIDETKSLYHIGTVYENMWKKCGTTLVGWKPENLGINHLSTGAGFRNHLLCPRFACRVVAILRSSLVTRQVPTLNVAATELSRELLGATRCSWRIIAGGSKKFKKLPLEKWTMLQQCLMPVCFKFACCQNGCSKSTRIKHHSDQKRGGAPDWWKTDFWIFLMYISWWVVASSNRRGCRDSFIQYCAVLNWSHTEHQPNSMAIWWVPNQLTTYTYRDINNFIFRKIWNSIIFNANPDAFFDHTVTYLDIITRVKYSTHTYYIEKNKYIIRYMTFV